MVDIPKAEGTFDKWNRSSETLSKSRFENELDKADTTNNGLSRREFGNVAKKLGMTANEADNAFDKFVGSDGRVDRDDFADAAFEGADTNNRLTAAEFLDFVEASAEEATAFELMGGASGDSISTAEMKEKIAEFAGGKSSRMSEDEFKDLASEMGVSDANLDNVSEVFDEITNGSKSASQAKVYDFFKAYAENNKFDEDAFDELVADLGGVDVDNGSPKPAPNT